MNKSGRFGFIPLSFVLIIIATSLINAVNIYKGNPIVASEYSSNSIFMWVILAITLEFAYLMIDKFLGGLFG